LNSNLLHALLPKYVLLSSETLCAPAELFPKLRRVFPYEVSRVDEKGMHCEQLNTLFAAIELTAVLIEEKYVSAHYVLKLRREQIVGSFVCVSCGDGDLS